ncbi:MAG: L,D-transpeptidase family protein [Acidimicrobiia bacterium]|nr:L,D-transpeptidase family protein [Acidimicrobiia bacterium]
MRFTWMLLLVPAILIAIIGPAHAMPEIHGEYTADGPWPLPGLINPGDHGPWVAELQMKLNESGFRAGDPDGEFGRETLAAVYAFQKVHDLERDGVFRQDDWNLLDDPLTMPGDAPESTRVEVDLDRQVLYLIEDDSVSLVLPISSANGKTYTHSSGSTVRAVTPEGAYAFYKKVDGWRISYLGGLYRPFYFSGGYAIHGSGSVPPYPASHGCIRVEMWDMDYLAAELELGMPVYVYGARNDRSSIVPTPPLSVGRIVEQRLSNALNVLMPI